MQVTIAICTWNRCALLRETLQRLSSIDPPADCAWQVLVINNNCSDGTSAVVASFRDRLSISEVIEPRPGLSHARNRALAEVTADYLLWIDDDVLVDSGWLRAFVEAARDHPEAAAFGGPVSPWFVVAPDPALARGFPILRDGFCSVDHGDTRRLLNADEPIYGANMAFAMRAVAGLAFDPRLGTVQGSGMAGEEEVFVGEVRRHGGAVLWIPGMRVLHYVEPQRMTLDYLTRFAYDRGRTFARLFVEPSQRRLFGAPRWAWREMVENYAKYWALRFTPFRGEALAGLREFHRARGVIAESSAQRRQERSAPAAQQPGDREVRLGARRPSEQ